MTPEEELKRVNRLIRQFESVYRTTSDALQRERVSRELRQLKTQKEQIESFHELDPGGLEEDVQTDELQGLEFLKRILAMPQKSREGADSALPEDREQLYLATYLQFFEHEFLPLLSEAKLKLDFKHSLERDGFYHRFGNLRRLFMDLDDEDSRMDPYFVEKHAEDLRQRSFKKKRNLAVEADRFFRSLVRFSGDLVEDIVQGGSVCLNHRDMLHFDRKIEGSRYLEGESVRGALEQLNNLGKEIVSFLNVPQIEAQES
ncbi:MAG: hypothetical protein JW820_06370 [Spirochaetales bacterium]|nr:hypothetical protein [Spirochaetales bacterium]